jgi:hypothetical protein
MGGATTPVIGSAAAVKAGAISRVSSGATVVGMDEEEKNNAANQEASGVSPSSTSNSRAY